MATKCQLCCLPSTKPGKWPFSPRTQDSWHILLHTCNHSTRQPSFGIQGSMHLLVGSLESIATVWSLKRHGSAAQQENQRDTNHVLGGPKNNQPTNQPFSPPSPPPTKKNEEKYKKNRTLRAASPPHLSALRTFGAGARPQGERALLCARCSSESCRSRLTASIRGAGGGPGSFFFFFFLGGEAPGFSWGGVTGPPPVLVGVLNVGRTTKK